MCVVWYEKYVLVDTWGRGALTNKNPQVCYKSVLTSHPQNPWLVVKFLRVSQNTPEQGEDFGNFMNHLKQS